MQQLITSTKEYLQQKQQSNAMLKKNKCWLQNQRTKPWPKPFFQCSGLCWKHTHSQGILCIWWGMSYSQEFLGPQLTENEKHPRAQRWYGKQCVSNFNTPLSFLSILPNARSDLAGLGGAWVSALLISSQVMLMLLVFRGRFQKQDFKTFFLLRAQLGNKPDWWKAWPFRGCGCELTVHSLLDLETVPVRQLPHTSEHMTCHGKSVVSRAHRPELQFQLHFCRPVTSLRSVLICKMGEQLFLRLLGRLHKITIQNA